MGWANKAHKTHYFQFTPKRTVPTLILITVQVPRSNVRPTLQYWITDPQTVAVFYKKKIQGKREACP